ncbi:OmpA family protein [Chthoniobacter flavus]|nr:OmpA family protein [Chthoniobacter flavus]
MAENDPSKTSTPSSGGAGMFLFFAVGLALMFVAVVIGWKLSRPKLDSKPIVAATPTPAPEAPPEKPSVTSAERQEVLKRIDRMPNVTAENKERLYAYVERAQNLQRLLTVSFETGRTRVSEKETARVVKASKQASFTAMARDAAAIFVVLGYADQHGDEKKNLQLSTERATSVMDLLRKQCGVHNVIQTVPMGSPLLFDPKNPGENRVAEIWTLVP